jgi:hypothetical protein
MVWDVFFFLFYYLYIRDDNENTLFEYCKYLNFRAPLIHHPADRHGTKASTSVSQYATNACLADPNFSAQSNVSYLGSIT